MLVKSCREMFSDFWCKGTIKKATGEMHYTYNEKLFFRKKAYLFTLLLLKLCPIHFSPFSYLCTRIRK